MALASAAARSMRQTVAPEVAYGKAGMSHRLIRPQPTLPAQGATKP